MSRVDLLSPQSAALRRWLSIVGIGEDGIDGLSPVARALVSGAEIVFGGKRHLGLAASLIRGAAKNHDFVTVLTDPADYLEFLAELAAHDGATTLDLRRRQGAQHSSSELGAGRTFRID